MLNGRDVAAERVRFEIKQDELAEEASIELVDRVMVGKIENGFPTSQDVYQKLIEAARRLGARKQKQPV